MMNLKIPYILGIVTIIFLVAGCTPGQEAQVHSFVEDLENEVNEGVQDMENTIEEGYQEAIQNDSVLDHVAATNANATQPGSCIIPQYPGSEEQVLNSAPMIAQGSYTTADDVATVQVWYDDIMVDTWFVELAWNRGSKRWVTGDFNVQSQIGCSAMIDIEENQEGLTTIGTVLMDFS